MQPAEDAVQREFKYLVLNYLQKEADEVSANAYASCTKIYFDKDYFLRLIVTDQVEKADELLTRYVDIKNESELLALLEVKKFLLFRCVLENNLIQIRTIVDSLKLIEGGNNIHVRMLLTKLFLDVNPFTDEAFQPYLTHDIFRKTVLGPRVLLYLEKSPNFQNIMTLPPMQDNILKKLVSNGVRYDHIKICSGKPSDKIEILSLLEQKHSCDGKK
ncbi:hypothetical protein EIN_020710 [Entamoeba invadens IP1]|uniref:hypothetical protein n=1 Tax=Entamoeba invadens IP1 TaxID=370355 RepID=UPI0002C3E397|nr:hypothetical protein EIN_020710 [Entamoeba invadens IP1]ELP90592.1 hypothetical protein EIN_020710 [Entamoeba invadens IP1]|eukprot:XP_004257363.1 hypothetical protein EIN_020710 [Entamoeba invadens IP1]